MSSLIEQAALRLAQIRQAGIDIPDVEEPTGAERAQIGRASCRERVWR